MAETQPDREPDRGRKDSDKSTPERRRGFQDRPVPSVTKVNRVINYAFRILESLIFIRLLLKALGANPVNAFVVFIDTITEPFVMPFLTVFDVPAISTSIGFVELGSLIAIAFYMLLNYAIVKLIWIVSSRG